VIEPGFDGKAGLKGPDLVRANGEGRIEAGDVFAGAAGAVEPIFLLSSLPFLATSVGDAARLYGIARPAYARALARHQARLLYAVPWPPSGLWAKAAVTRPEALAGLTIRTYDETSTEVFRRLGAAPVALAFGDVIAGLKAGSLAAVLSSGDGGAGRQLWQWLPAFTPLGYASPLSIAAVNAAAFEHLPPDLRHAVEAAARATEAALWQLIPERLAANYADMRAHGVTIATAVAPSLRSALARAAADSIEAWANATGGDGGAILARYRAGPPARGGSPRPEKGLTPSP
jgi:TRAP-type C4-dicarboxylate transport system substrate-binding protein